MGREELLHRGDGRFVEDDKGQLLRPPRTGGEDGFQHADDRADAFEFDEDFAVFRHGFKNFAQGWNAGVTPGVAFPEARVEVADFGQRQFRDGSVYAAGAETVVVVHADDFTVFGQVEIPFDAGCAARPGQGERLHGIFRRDDRFAAMGHDFDRHDPNPYVISGNHRKTQRRLRSSPRRRAKPRPV
ncbi:hypothetical protein SDC9_141828 [bioreactor metagenome]|uniref:Uncharacterized protein n=1 Tax=bioreactor metagenome TaxID=1076179 RepID=A0A645DYT6_9ZZZZ